jgi:hypothetical protein
VKGSDRDLFLGNRQKVHGKNKEAYMKPVRETESQEMIRTWNLLNLSSRSDNSTAAVYMEVG